MAEPNGPTPPKLPRPWPAPVVESRLVSALARRLAGSDPATRARLTEEFWENDAAVTPVIEAAEGERSVVTFLWRDADAVEVLLFVNRVTDEQDLGGSLMVRLPATDLWSLSYLMADDWRASYAFVPSYPGEVPPWQSDQVGIRKALDRGLPDPRNPMGIRNRRGHEQSVVALPAAPAQPWLAPRGRHRPAQPLTGPGGGRCWLRPPLSVSGDHSMVLLLDGQHWVERASISLDNLVADKMVTDPYLVMIDSVDRASRWRELADPAQAALLAGPWLDWCRERFAVSDDPSRIVVAGQSLGALTALRTVLRHPLRIGAALSQSASLWLGGVGRGTGAGRFEIQVGSQEWVLAQPNRDLAAELSDSTAEVRLREYNGGHDDAWWQGGLADGLVNLIGDIRARPARGLG